MHTSLPSSPYLQSTHAEMSPESLAYLKYRIYCMIQLIAAIRVPGLSFDLLATSCRDDDSRRKDALPFLVYLVQQM